MSTTEATIPIEAYVFYMINAEGSVVLRGVSTEKDRFDSFLRDNYRATYAMDYVGTFNDGNLVIFRNKYGGFNVGAKISIHVPDISQVMSSEECKLTTTEPTITKPDTETNVQKVKFPARSWEITSDNRLKIVFSNSLAVEHIDYVLPRKSDENSFLGATISFDPKWNLVQVSIDLDPVLKALEESMKKLTQVASEPVKEVEVESVVVLSQESQNG